MSKEREEWKNRNFFRNYGCSPQALDPKTATLYDGVSYQEMSKHPIDAFAENCGCDNWDALLIKLREGFIATGAIPVFPSKSSIGITMLTFSLNKEEGLIYFFEEESLGIMTVGFRKYFSEDVLAKHDARCTELLARIEKFNKQEVLDADDKRSSFSKQGDAAMKAVQLAVKHSEMKTVHDSVFDGDQRIPTGVKRLDKEGGFAKGSLAIMGASAGGSASIFSGSIKGQRVSFEYPNLQYIKKKK